jgi:ABC-type transport system substrate-binding protein
MYRFGPVIDPSGTGILSCSQIPTAANGYGGGNWDHWCDRAADHLMRRSDQELDVAKRADEIQGIGTLIAKDLPMLPLYTLPNVAAWRTDKLAGIDPADVSSPYGFFVGLPSWHIA